LKIGIVGATGKVGRMILTCLEESNVEFNELVLYASARSAGSYLKFNDTEFLVRELNESIYNDNLDFIFLTAGGDISRKYAPMLAKSGAIVIDNSSAFRRDESVPLIIPEVNGNLLKSYKGIVANPNCSTIQLLLILKPLNDYLKINKVVVTTMQSVSGAGYSGIIELMNQRKDNDTCEVFPKKIYMNVIPQIGEIQEDNYCSEEDKMRFEAKKILNIDDFNLVATTVRVPVVYGHSESVYIEFSNKIDLNKIKDVLSESKGIAIEHDYMTPLEIRESDLSHVSRIRYAGDEKSVFLWNVAHNVRLGAATNAVKIFSVMINSRGG